LLAIKSQFPDFIFSSIGIRGRNGCLFYTTKKMAILSRKC
jgi:hypothetical protein